MAVRSVDVITVKYWCIKWHVYIEYDKLSNNSNTNFLCIPDKLISSIQHNMAIIIVGFIDNLKSRWPLLLACKILFTIYFHCKNKCSKMKKKKYLNFLLFTIVILYI